jgi:hypothetical protein
VNHLRPQPLHYIFKGSFASKKIFSAQTIGINFMNSKIMETMRSKIMETMRSKIMKRTRQLYEFKDHGDYGIKDHEEFKDHGDYENKDHEEDEVGDFTVTEEISRGHKIGDSDYKIDVFICYFRSTSTLTCGTCPQRRRRGK